MIQVNPGGNVRFTFDYHTFHQVYLVGDFNKWDTKSHPLRRVSKTWTIDLKLSPGEYRYNYLADEILYSDLQAHRYDKNNQGAEVSIVIVPPQNIN